MLFKVIRFPAFTKVTADKKRFKVWDCRLQLLTADFEELAVAVGSRFLPAPLRFKVTGLR